MDTLLHDPRASFGMMVGSAYRAMLRRLGRRFVAAGYDVTPEQWSIMLHLWRADGPSQQALADLADRDKPTITRMVDSMERRGFVTRIGHKNDGRVKQIYLTETGHAARADLAERSREATEDALRGIDPRDLEVALSVLERIRANLETDSNEDSSHANETTADGTGR